MLAAHRNRRRTSPLQDAEHHISCKTDKTGLQEKFINKYKGRGVFSSEAFFRGDFVLEYRGELISQESLAPAEVYSEVQNTFLFDFQWHGKHWCMDASKEDGSLGRLVNDEHKNPTCKMRIITVNQQPHLCLFAVQDIKPGEEITYSYGDSDWPWRAKRSSPAPVTATSSSSSSLPVRKRSSPAPVTATSSSSSSSPVRKKFITCPCDCYIILILIFTCEETFITCPCDCYIILILIFTCEETFITCPCDCYIILILTCEETFITCPCDCYIILILTCEETFITCPCDCYIILVLILTC
uniref:SET domain-containing protein n=1 Tax=Cyprinus carpio carpio TaxID=630221 RepID=A0A9J8DAQ8_CYPCA